MNFRSAKRVTLTIFFVDLVSFGSQTVELFIERNHGKLFEPRSISSLSCVIVRLSVVLKRTVGDSD